MASRRIAADLPRPLLTFAPLLPEPRVELALERSPRRAVTSLNLRFEDKEVFDAFQAYWSAARRPLTQWDAFSMLLALALEHPDAAPVCDLIRQRARAAHPM